MKWKKKDLWIKLRCQMEKSPCLCSRLLGLGRLMS